MQKLLRYINRRQWAMIAASIAFIVVQVWLDLKLPDYMSAITTLVQTEGSAMADILTQGGVYAAVCPGQRRGVGHRGIFCRPSGGGAGYDAAG